MSITLRSAVRLAVATNTHIPEHPAKRCPAELFGRDVFGMAAMRERLPAKVFKRLEQAAVKGKSLLEGDADIIAGAGFTPERREISSERRSRKPHHATPRPNTRWR